MTLLRAKDGNYECDFRVKGLPRFHGRLKTKNKKVAQARHEAVAKLYRQRRTAMIDQLKAGDLTVERVEAMMEHNEPLQPLTVADEAHSWGTVNACADRLIQAIERHPNRSDKTAKVAAWQLSHFRAFAYEGIVVGELDMDAVTPEMVEAYQQSLVTGRVPRNTITTVMSRVKALWNFVRKTEERDAQKERRAPRPVYSPVDAERIIRDIHRRDRFLSESEMAAVIAQTPDAARFPVFCALMAGLRVEEMLHLRPTQDVDLEHGTITVRDQEGWTPKTRRSRRTIPMAAPLLEAAKHHAERYAKHGWMMPSVMRTEIPLTQSGWRLTFKPIIERAELTFGNKVPHGVTYHTLRHTFASHAVMRGVDLYTVAQLLGDSLQMVEATYAHLSPDHKRAAIQKMEGAFKMPQPVPQPPEEK